jgi:2-C-methyl-D-erythritol 4-phosphate cytidylyltransferase
MSSCSAILLAAGKSQRLGFDKILTPLCGQPVLLYSLRKLLASEWVGELILVTRKDIIPAIEKLVEEEKPNKPWRVIEGGEERQYSVFQGLQSVGDGFELVLIHDAARPLLSDLTIQKTVEAARLYGGAVAAHRASDTLKEVAESGQITQTLDRSKTWLMETPQVFHKKLITDAYGRIIAEKAMVTDDASAVERMGAKVVVVESESLNLKITRATDWQILELWLNREQGKELRHSVHQLSNDLTPLVGYMSLLGKYGGGDPKFLEYWEKCQNSTKDIQGHMREIRNLLK